jgi:hypothetical protein
VSAVWRVPSAGGEETQVAANVWDRAFAPVRDGLYYISAARGEVARLQFLRFAPGEVEPILPIRKRLLPGMALSPDGRTLLFGQLDQQRNRMLVKHFQ